MAWVDPTTGRRYNEAEVATMEQGETPAPPAASASLGMTDPAVAMGRALSPESIKNIGAGMLNSFKRPYLGMKQAGAYLFGDDASREAVNKDVQDLEAQQAETGPAGAMGDFLGNAAQFVIPGSILSKVGKVLPGTAKIAQKVTGTPGSVGRGMLDSAAFEASQPVDPSDLSNEDFLLKKGVNVAKGVAIAAPSAAVAKHVTRPWLEVSPEKAALVKDAERQGVQLTPAQRTGDRTLQQLEEGLLAKPGSGKVIGAVRNQPQTVLNKKSAEAMGLSDALAPNEGALASAWEQSGKGYDFIKQIPNMSPDIPYFDAVHNFIKLQQSMPATGSKQAASVAKALMQQSHKMSGDQYFEQLQGMRDLAFDAVRNGDTASARQFRDLADIMGEFSERKVEQLAKMKGSPIPPDAMTRFKEARTQKSVIHAIEDASDPITGNVNANKILKGEFKRSAAHSGRSQTPTGQKLKDVGDVARIMRQTQPYIGSSGTAERMAGQDAVDTWTNPLRALKGGVPLAKNYLAAKYYLKYGAEPSFLAKHVSPDANMMVRRMIPQDVLAAEEAQ